ncbi:DUF2970 domain-containing protein [Thiohalophilus sp.]|uniref:DUF2970 domain-containing protein n=1 Tax=Thiohalophilus sp. TaxID=3028392 RepID=UPI0039771B0D
MDDDNKQAPGLWDVAKSVMAAFLGVQKSKHYERDFTHGKPWQYITLGLIGVVIFIAVIIGVVNLVLSLAGV